MKTATSGVVLLLLGLISCADGARVKDNVTCPEEFENIHRSCFRFVNERKRWEDALSFCEEHNSDLAALEAFQEKRAVNEVIEEKYSADTMFWFGYRLRTNGRRQSTKDQVWEWIPSKQDIQSQIIPWYSSNFKMRPKTYCGGVLFTSSPPRGTKSTLLLHNGRCREQRFFVCEHKPPARPPQTTTVATTTITTIKTATPLLSAIPTGTTASRKDEKRGKQKTEELHKTIEEEQKVKASDVVKAPCQGFGGTPSDSALYRSYLRSAINANEAKVQYYTEVSRLYADALEAQKRYHSSLQEKLDLELAMIRARK